MTFTLNEYLVVLVLSHKVCWFCYLGYVRAGKSIWLYNTNYLYIIIYYGVMVFHEDLHEAPPSLQSHSSNKDNLNYVQFIHVEETKYQHKDISCLLIWYG